MLSNKHMQHKGIRHYHFSQPSSRPRNSRAREAPNPLDSAVKAPLGNLSAYRYAYHCEGSRMGFHAGCFHSAC